MGLGAGWHLHQLITLAHTIATDDGCPQPAQVRAVWRGCALCRQRTPYDGPDTH